MRPIPPASNGTGLYDIVVADPPWQYEKGTTTPKRTIEEQYKTMTLDEICEMGKDLPIAKKALLFLWVPAPKLEEGLRVLRAWGFSYRTGFVWYKVGSSGMGHWAHIDHEHCLLGKRGNFPTPGDKCFSSSVIVKRRGKHSEKPMALFDIIHRMYRDQEYSCLELFARRPHHGWTVWGDQVDCGLISPRNGKPGHQTRIKEYLK